MNVYEGLSRPWPAPLLSACPLLARNSAVLLAPFTDEMAEAIPSGSCLQSKVVFRLACVILGPLFPGPRGDLEASFLEVTP